MRLFGGAGMDDAHTAEVVADPRSKAGHGDYQTQEDPAWSPLFAGKPTIDDVKQGGLGDCYLLSAITSVVHTNPDHFYNNMRDNLDGTVTVKLYRRANEPVNYTLKKSIVGNTYAQGALWVRLLEKAYAAAGFSGKTGVLSSENRSYAAIEGGDAGVALEHLVGKEARAYPVGRRKQEVPAMISKAMIEEQGRLTKEIQRIDVIFQEKKEKKEDTKAEEDQIKILMGKLSAIQAPIGKLAEKLELNYVSQLTLEEFVKENSNFPELTAIVEKIAGVGTERPLFPGALGSGEYGPDELEAYGLIKENIDAGRPLTASAKNSIVDAENPAEEKRGIAGETKVSGLAGKHEYSILDYSPKEFGAKQMKAKQKIMIKLRNPWGEYGRKYVIDKGGKMKGVADPGGNGIFWIDVADLVAFFQSISFLR